MLHHYILRPQADQLRAVGLLFDDGLHNELPKGSALNAVNTEGYRNDEFKAIHIIADAVVLPDMTTHTLLFQNANLAHFNCSSAIFTFKAALRRLTLLFNPFSMIDWS